MKYSIKAKISQKNYGAVLFRPSRALAFPPETDPPLEDKSGQIVGFSEKEDIMGF